MKKIILIVITLVIVGGVGYFVLMNDDNSVDIKESASPEAKMVMEEPKEDTTQLEQPVNGDPIVTIKTNPETLVTNLIDVSGGESSGTGYILRENGKVYHVVNSDLPDPADGNKYEGWLVRQQPLSFFSTGVMTKTENGYNLMYEGEIISPDHNFVVITEETVIDNIPEKHIIEGLAQ